MSTTLYAVCNAPTPIRSKATYDRLVDELKALHIPKSFTVSAHEGTPVRGTKDWDYRIFEPDEWNDQYEVEFDGDFMIYPAVVEDVVYFSICYNYYFIYKNYQLDFFGKTRQELFEILKILGGTEVIFLADNGANKLHHYLDFHVLEGRPYQEIKDLMRKEMGAPVTDYKLLDHDKLEYATIDEYFLDDFQDLWAK